MSVNKTVALLQNGLQELQEAAAREIQEKQDEIDGLKEDLAAVVELKAKLGEANKLAEDRLTNVTLLQEQCDAVKPTIEEVLDIANDTPMLSADQTGRLEAFLNFSVPGEVQEALEATPPKESDDLDALKLQAGADDDMFAINDEEPEAEEEEEEEEEEELEEPYDPQAEGQHPFDDEVALSEVEWWEKRGAAYTSIRPATSHTQSLVKDPEKPETMMATGYKFNVMCEQKEDDMMPSFHLDETDSTDGMQLLRIRCGKPYQDICYQISNKKWMTQDSNGFVNDYENGRFRLHVNLELS